MSSNALTPVVSERMRELVEAACDWEWTTGKYTGQHASAFTQQRSTEEAATSKDALLREIAALEDKAAHGGRGTLIAFSHYLARKMPMQCAILGVTSRFVDGFLAQQEAPHA